MKKCLAPLLVALAASGALAGQFSVAPLRMDLTDRAPAGSVSITNDDSEPLRLKVSAVRWVQDANGVDSYEPTQDVAFFPLELEVAPGAKRVKTPAATAATVATTEKAYRLFLEEVPSAAGAGASRIGVAVKFGVAVWHRPAREALALSFKADTFKSGVGEGWIVNDGNVHVRLAGATADPLTFGELKSWYLLPGAARKVEFKGDAAACKPGLAIVADTEEGKLPVSMPGPLCLE
jgi:fimbrial chaperone protein